MCEPEYRIRFALPGIESLGAREISTADKVTCLVYLSADSGSIPGTPYGPQGMTPKC